MAGKSDRAHSSIKMQHMIRHNAQKFQEVYNERCYNNDNHCSESRPNEMQEMGDLAKWEKQIMQRDKVLLRKKTRKGVRGGGKPVRRAMPPVRGS